MLIVWTSQHILKSPLWNSRHFTLVAMYIRWQWNPAITSSTWLQCKRYWLSTKPNKIIYDSNILGTKTHIVWTVQTVEINFWWKSTGFAWCPCRWGDSGYPLARHLNYCHVERMDSHHGRSIFSKELDTLIVSKAKWILWACHTYLDSTLKEVETVNMVTMWMRWHRIYVVTSFTVLLHGSGTVLTVTRVSLGIV